MKFTLGMSSSPSVTVTVKWVWVKNSSSIQSGWSSGARVNLSGCKEKTKKNDIQDVRNRKEMESSMNTRAEISRRLGYVISLAADSIAIGYSTVCIIIMQSQ